jgi:hypothetical protein
MINFAINYKIMKKLFNNLTIAKLINNFKIFFKLIFKLIYELLIIFTLIFLILGNFLDISIFEFISINLKNLLQLILGENNDIITFSSNNISNYFTINCPPEDIPNTASTSTVNNTNSDTLKPLKDSFSYKAEEGAKVTVSPETISKISDKLIDNLPGITSTVASGIATGAGGTGAMMAASRLVKNTPLPITAKAGVIIGMGTAGAAGVSIGSQVGTTVGRNLNQYLESQVNNSPFNQPLPDDRAPSPNPDFSINSMLDNFELSN